MVKGVFFLRKISFIFFLFLSVMFFTFSSFAGVASGSNAMRVPRASWSNASKAWDDFKDGFDRINDVDAVASDDVAMFASNSISYNGLAYRSDGGTWSFTTTVGGVVDLPSLGGDVYYTGFYLQLGKPDLPSYGKYNFSFSLFDVLQNVRSAGVDNVSADYLLEITDAPVPPAQTLQELTAKKLKDSLAKENQRGVLMGFHGTKPETITLAPKDFSKIKAMLKIMKD